jgi:hypothetical protein
MMPFAFSSLSCVPVSLGFIAVTAQELDVPDVIRSPFRVRGDVVELEIVTRAAMTAPSAVSYRYGYLDILVDVPCSLTLDGTS